MATKRLSKWQRVAVALGGAIVRGQLDSCAVEVADASGRRKWVVAVSGGADSVALVLLLWAHWPDRRSRLVLAHFNHALRGGDSRGDQQFCRKLARSLEIEFETSTWLKPPNKPSEAQSRAARQEFLEQVRRRHRAHLIWTGHHLNDVAETMLMRLSRGSGAAGLSAPRAVQAVGSSTPVRRLRPLLGLPRSDLAEALEASGGVWREDETNLGGEYFRNRVRQDVIPRWVEASGRDALRGAGLSRQLLEEDDAALAEWLVDLAVIDGQGRLLLKRLKGKPMAIWRRALRDWLIRQDDPGDLSRAGFDELLKRAREGRTTRFSLGKSGFARIRRGFLFFEQPFGG